MPWKVEFEVSAGREFDKLDRPVQRRIKTFIEDKLQPSANPRLLGAPLSGPLAGLWKFRVGDYRMVCDVVDRRLVVLVLRVRHRKHVYR